MFALGYLVQRLMIQIRRIVSRSLSSARSEAAVSIFTSICSASKQALWNASWLFSSAALVMASQ